MRTEDLVEKYFEGNTSAREEQELRRRFASGQVPEQLEVYRPLFAYFDEEIRQSGKVVPKRPNLRKIYTWIAGAAAAVVLLLGISQQLTGPGVLCGESYVIINGKCFTDPQMIRTHALSALQEVATPAADYFPKETPTAESAILQEQLKELSSIFNED